jgi:macrolide transport system ATP-binding/permease protein
METLTIKLKDIKKQYGVKEVLAIDELTAYQGDRIGIVGRNGQGKSTLLKIIKGEIQPDQGYIQRTTNFGYFSQAGEVEEIQSSLDWELASRFGLPKHTTATWSGGEETKLRLVQTLSNYELGLLLDEPTTHLDRQGIDLLISELTYYYGTLLFVSHDRYFLNQLATKIWEIDQGKIREYQGNYDKYKEQKENELLQQKRALENHTKEKKRLQAAIENKRQQAEKSSKVSAKNKQRNTRPDRLASSKQKDTIQKNLHKTAKALESRLAHLGDQETIETQRPILFPSSKSVEIHNPYPVRGENISIQYNERVLFKECDFQFGLGKKIAIVGDNGCGKTTLLNHILNNGQGIVLSPKVVFSYYQQMSYKVAGEESILTYLLRQTEYPEAVVRSILHNLGFAQEETTKSVNSLSGGEATRIQIALLFVKPSNVLILDEPTNFIDLPTIEAVEHLIKAYRGTVIMTSHDPLFINHADEVYQVVDQKLKLITD